MKKIALLALSIAITATLMAGCGQTQEKSVSPSASVTESEEKTESSEPEEESPKERPASETAMFSKKAAIQTTELYSADNVRITANELKYSEDQVELELTLENDSDKDLTFTTGSLGYSRNSVNGYMTDDLYLNETVNAGMKSNETIVLDAVYPALAGITDIADITLDFEIEDEDYNTVAQTGPLVIKTSLADSWDYGTDYYAAAMKKGEIAGEYDIKVDRYSEEPLYDQNGVRISSSALLTRDDEKLLRLEVENTTDADTQLAVSDITINGLVVSSGIWDAVWISAGKRGFIDLGLSDILDSFDGDAVGIDDIQDLSFTVQAFDGQDNETGEPAKVSVKLGDGDSSDAASYDSSGEKVYEQNDIQIISKGIRRSTDSDDEDLHLILVIQNNRDEEIDLYADEDSVAVNDTMIDALSDDPTVPSGAAATMDISLDGDSLSSNQITGPEDIQKVFLKLEIDDEEMDTIDEPEISLSMNQ